MKNIYMYLIILFILISCSNACASSYPSDLEMSNPIGDLQTGQQWLNDDASTKVCAATHRDYNFCLNNNNKYNLGYDCYKEKMALKNCWDNHWAMVERNCQMSKNNYFYSIDTGNYQLADKIIEGANGCDWQKREIKRKNDFYNAKKTPDYQSVAQGRPVYPVDGTCGRIISQEELAPALAEFKNLVNTQWKPKKAVTHNTLFNTVIGLSRYVNRDRYLENVKIWEEKVNCFDQCVQARPTQNITSSDSTRFRNCTVACGKMTYMKCP